MPARALAAQVIHQVINEGRSLDGALEDFLSKLTDDRRKEAPLIQELAYGSLRWGIQLQGILDGFLDKPLKAKEGEVQALLWVGLYQLMHLRVAPHAAVSETVAAAQALGKPWAKGLINAVLRAYLRNPDAAQAQLVADPVLSHSHPAWLVEALRTAWPADWPSICQANNSRPPMTLRVNARKTTRLAYQQTLAAAGLAATPVAAVASALILEKHASVTGLPGFAAGDVAVQDGAAQLAAWLLDAQPGETILDACAAPGGKTSHVLERTPDIQLLALDQDAKRITLVHENLARLGHQAQVLAADAAQLDTWWNKKPFDRILLDVPCSATGVIRRHPDIKYHRTPQDLQKLMATQTRLLEALWPTLARGGRLLYVTCSVLPQENEQQIAAFLKQRPDAQALALSLNVGRCTGNGWQILPGEENLDGFYYACLGKA